MGLINKFIRCNIKKKVESCQGKNKKSMVSWDAI
jgi:hypothetical protein